MAKEMYTLPDGTVTPDPVLAAEKWAAAFYQAKDALSRIRPITEMILQKKPVRDLAETLAECDAALSLGDK